jgi:hypothetical protein
MSSLPALVGRMWRMIPACTVPEGIAQLWNVSVLGSKRIDHRSEQLFPAVARVAQAVLNFARLMARQAHRLDLFLAGSMRQAAEGFAVCAAASIGTDASAAVTAQAAFEVRVMTGSLFIGGSRVL